MGKQSFVESAKAVKKTDKKPERAERLEPLPAAPLEIKPAPKAMREKPESMRSRQKAEPEWSIPKSEFLKVKIEHIDDEGFNARVEIDENAPEFAELCQSIQMAGLVEPIVVTPLDDAKKNKAGLRYDLVAGFRRFRAMKRVGSRETMVVLHHYTHPAQRIIVNLLENRHRVDLRAYEEANAFKRLRDEGFRVATISEKLGISETKVGNYVSCIENLCPELLEVFRRNSEATTLSMLIQLSRASKEEQESYYRALSMAKAAPTEKEPKPSSEKAPKPKSRDQLRAFLGDLVRAEAIMVEGDEVFLSDETRGSIEAAMRWAVGEVRSFPLVLPPGDKSDRKRDD